MRDKGLKQDSHYILLVTDLEHELIKQHTSPAKAEQEQYYLQLPQGIFLSTKSASPYSSQLLFFLSSFFFLN